MQLRSVAKAVTRFRSVLRRLRHPSRLFAYLILKAAYHGKWSTVPVTPVCVDIEPINSCNFRCEHCQVTHWNKARTQLEIDAFRRIVAQLPFLNEIKLQGMGEPLLNKHLIELLEEGERRGIGMRFHSNASACTESNAKRLLELRNTSITFSIDGACAQTFEQIRPGSRFAQICRNIRHLTNGRNGQRLPRISGWTVLTTENIRELPQIVRLCGELGLDRVTLQPFLTGWGKPDLGNYVATIKVDALADSYAALLQEAHLAADAANIELATVDAPFTKSKPCSWPWESAYIAANGDVVPCCIVADSDVVKMGNVFEQPLSQIWNSGAYQTLRARIRDHDLPAYCRGCYSDAPQSNASGAA